MEMSLQLAQRLVSAAVEQAEAEFKRPICVAVCDQYGFLSAFARMDGVPIRTIEISQGKAYSASRMGSNTDAFLERLRREDVPSTYFCDDKLTALPGGSVVKDCNGKVIGGVGISGLAPHEDQTLANRVASPCLGGGDHVPASRGK